MIFIIFNICLLLPNKIITVVSESRPHLDIGTIRIMKELLIKAQIFSDNQFNGSKGYYQFNNGSILEFFSADRIGKALGARRFMLFGNEINSLKFDIWDELARRSEYIIGDFNPTSEFWLEKFLEFYGEHIVIKSNYLSNPFLPVYEKERIIKHAEIDENFKRVHIDCEYGILEGLVFKNWAQVNEIPPRLRKIYGLDFGYSNDPAALVATAIDGNNLYIDEIFYETRLTNIDIRRKLNENRLNFEEIIADSAEPKSIEEVFRNPHDSLGKFNIKPSMKGSDSVNFGINKMKQFNIFVTKRSLNLIRELRNYAWMMDKNNEPLDRPVDAFNHGIDAARYAVMKRISSGLKYQSS